MRELLFRGQTRKLGEKVYMTGEKVPGNWVYGGIFQGTGCYSVMYGCPDANDITGATLEKHVVYTDTVGQFTGLTDKNGTKIFEGDIVKYPDTYLSWSGDVDVKGNVGAVEWDKATMCFYFSNRIAVEMEEFFVLNGCMTEVEVIGNIHDNPELLKGGADNVE